MRRRLRFLFSVINVIGFTTWLIFNFYQITDWTPKPELLNQPIYFISSNIKDAEISLRAACAIESASLHNPYSEITLLTLHEPDNRTTTQLLHLIPNVHLKQMNIAEILSDTPLYDWYLQGDYTESLFKLTHMSDALRLAILWKFGGIYMDTDIWSVKGVSHLHNTIAKQSVLYVNGAVMMFDKSHPFLHDCMEEFSRNYQKNEFTAQGPDLLTRVILKKCGIDVKVIIGDVDPADVEKCVNVTVLPPESFYPIPFYRWNEYFEDMPVTGIGNPFTITYTFHLWNNLSKRNFTKAGSGVLVDQIARYHCPNVYKLMMINGKV